MPSAALPRPSKRAERRLIPAAPRAAAWLVALVVVAGGLVTLPQYGVTCDEALGDMFFGERYLHFFATRDPAYLDFQRHELPIHRREPDLFRSPWRAQPWVFPPLADTLSAAGMEGLGHRLAWLDPFDAFHAATVLLVGALLVGLFEFAAPRIGAASALVGVTLLGTYPRFWGDMHDNVKDVPEAVFFAFTVMAVTRWSEAPSLRRALVAGLAGGAALATKVNAVFVPLVVIVGLWPWARSTRPWKPVARHLMRFGRHYLLMTAVAGATFVAAWPFLYRRTFARLGKHVVAFVSQGHRAPHSGWNADPVVQTVATMPELFLALLAAGLAVASCRLLRGRDEGGLARLLLAWLAVPIVRSSVPGAVNFDGIRHFVEFLPAAAMIAGLGAGRLLSLGHGAWRAFTAALLAAGIVVQAADAWARFHPFEPIYFNRLVGGLAGAARDHHFAEATDYWGSSYRQGLRWLNDHAEPGAWLHVGVHPQIVTVTAGLWLRPDVLLVGIEGYDGAVSAGPAVYVMSITRPEYYSEVAAACARERRPVYQIDVDGRTVLEIYRVARASRCGGEP